MDELYQIKLEGDSVIIELPNTPFNRNAFYILQRSPSMHLDTWENVNESPQVAKNVRGRLTHSWTQSRISSEGAAYRIAIHFNPIGN